MVISDPYISTDTIFSFLCYPVHSVIQDTEVYNTCVIYHKKSWWWNVRMICDNSVLYLLQFSNVCVLIRLHHKAWTDFSHNAIYCSIPDQIRPSLYFKMHNERNIPAKLQQKQMYRVIYLIVQDKVTDLSWSKWRMCQML